MASLPSPLPYPIHPIVDVVYEIDQGQDPWAFFNAFYHDWWWNAVDYRQHLIVEPPAIPTTEAGKRWAAFAAATVEELCNRFSVLCPEWTEQEIYFLKEQWFVNSHPSQRKRLQSTTLLPYRRRNVYAGGNVLDNKYELKKQLGLPENYVINRVNSWILSRVEPKSKLASCPKGRRKIQKNCP